ncbi:putative cell wall-binding protein [Kineococcus xinjiangensis]|uniref:Putative cell wall-binding protein n=1 Tax=Kineococcus xinjiangensis TaxID=512762 RepID=A0A2S6IFX7_9ACTN|nr:cell wall-binding repeat-containing protein [Kineococcus xinjiangensis]PPK93097.1 putative cell wall-binding protein [Kineococcus xinjiangensis]
MSAATSRLRRSGIGAGVAALVGLTGVGFTAVAAEATPTFDLTRPANVENRFATAASVATATFPTGATNVVIANGDNAVDALGAAALAGTTAPILYVQSGSIPAETLAALNALKPTTVWAVGGTNAISEAVLNALPASVTTKNRIQGGDRYETAAKIAAQAQAVRGGTAPTSAFLARGDVFADALAIAPVAAKTGTPIYLTQTGSLNSFALAGLKAQGIKNVTILGGEAAVSVAVRDALAAQGITVTRIAGADRAETALNVAQTAAFGFSKAGVALVNGFAPVDALPASVYAAKNNFPIILTEGAVLGNDAETYLKANAATLTSGVAIGGVAVLPVAVVEAAEAAGGAGQLGTIAVAPNTAVTTTLVNDTAGPNDAADDRTYTVTGLTAGTTYRITLVNGASIQTGADGAVTFLTGADANAASGFSVATGADIADITSVNNAAATFAEGDTEKRTTTAQPVAGNLTFTIDATAPGTVVPVVYVNGGPGGTATTGGTSIRLETSGTAAGTFAAATELYGLGGATTVTAPLAAAGSVTGGTVVSVDRAANSFTTATSGATVRYTYDSTDKFTLGGVSVGLGTFEAALTSGDGITGTFAVDPDGSSDFVLADDNPATPAAPTFTVGTGANSNDVTLTTVLSGDVDAVQVERATVTGSTVGAYAVIATPTADADAAAPGFQYVDNDVAAGTYNYRVSFVNDGQIGRATAAATNATTTTPVNDTTAPTAADVRVASNVGNALLLDAGDTFTVAASEVVTVAGNATLRLRDADGTAVDLVNGVGGTTFVLSTGSTTIGGTAYAAGRVVTVTVGTATGLDLPATIVSQAGIADAATNALTLTGSDVTVNIQS